jgi:hypothetical protein
VHGAGVARRDEVVAVAVLVDAVDVEVVPRVGRVVARAGLARVEGEDGFRGGDVVEGVPLEEEGARGDVEFCVIVTKRLAGGWFKGRLGGKRGVS